MAPPISLVGQIAKDYPFYNIKRFNNLNGGFILVSLKKSHSWKWDKRFLELAKLTSSWSKDPSTKVGCVIVDRKNRVLSVAYNGFPCGVDDDDKHYSDREVKLQRTIHAETNAIIFAKQDLEGCTMYVFPLPSCASCATKIIQTGIARVVTIRPTREQEDRWGDSFKVSYKMFKEAGVEVNLVTKEELECASETQQKE